LTLRLSFPSDAQSPQPEHSLGRTRTRTPIGTIEGRPELVMNQQPAAMQRFRAIWISDTHLGTTGCQASRLLEFLRRTESDYLYLVGDIIDGWQLRRRWYWHQTHNDVVQKILRKARKGTEVVYIPGNHDEAVSHFLDLAFGGIKIRREQVHRTALGLELLVIHGDLFDAVVQHARWLAYLGDWLYTLTLRLNHHFNALRARISSWPPLRLTGCAARAHPQAPSCPVKGAVSVGPSAAFQVRFANEGLHVTGRGLPCRAP
jgi:predicted phosphodiesterase